MHRPQKNHPKGPREIKKIWAGSNTQEKSHPGKSNPKQPIINISGHTDLRIL